MICVEDRVQEPDDRVQHPVCTQGLRHFRACWESVYGRACWESVYGRVISVKDPVLLNLRRMQHKHRVAFKVISVGKGG